MNGDGFNFSYERILSVIVIIMSAFIIGYNTFYKPSLEVIEFNSVVNSTARFSNDYDNDYDYDEYITETEVFNKFDVTGNNDKIDEQEITYPININTATAEELSDGLDGIGEVMASRIIEYREKVGEFTDISQLMEVQGIGESKFNNIKNYITVE